MEDILHRIPRAGERLSGLSRDQVYKLLKHGLLKGVKAGGMTFITKESLAALPHKLPAYTNARVVGRKKAVEQVVA